jgi:chloride channel protein, CIC family
VPVAAGARAVIKREAFCDITVSRLAQSAEPQRLRKQLVLDLAKPALTMVPLDADLASIDRMLPAHPVKYLNLVDNDGLYQGVVPIRAFMEASAEQRHGP